jgi:ATP-binding protein involved in chromosome partitioning
MVRQTLLDVRWAPLDYLLIDLPPGTGEPQQGLVQTVHVDGAVVVTTPQDLSLLDAGRSLGLFRQAGVPILGVVENMSSLICPHCGEPIEVFQRTDRRWLVRDDHLDVLGRIPLHPDISRSIDAGHPLLRAAPAAAEAAAFRDIADQIAAKLPLP